MGRTCNGRVVSSSNWTRILASILLIALGGCGPDFGRLEASCDQQSMEACDELKSIASATVQLAKCTTEPAATAELDCDTAAKNWHAAWKVCQIALQQTELDSLPEGWRAACWIAAYGRIGKNQLTDDNCPEWAVQNGRCILAPFDVASMACRYGFTLGCELMADLQRRGPDGVDRAHIRDWIAQGQAYSCNHNGRDCGAILANLDSAPRGIEFPGTALLPRDHLTVARGPWAPTTKVAEAMGKSCTAAIAECVSSPNESEHCAAIFEQCTLSADLFLGRETFRLGTARLHDLIPYACAASGPRCLRAIEILTGQSPEHLKSTKATEWHSILGTLKTRCAKGINCDVLRLLTDRLVEGCSAAGVGCLILVEAFPQASPEHQAALKKLTAVCLEDGVWDEEREAICFASVYPELQARSRKQSASLLRHGCSVGQSDKACSLECDYGRGSSCWIVHRFRDGCHKGHRPSCSVQIVEEFVERAVMYRDAWAWNNVLAYCNAGNILACEYAAGEQNSYDTYKWAEKYHQLANAACQRRDRYWCKDFNRYSGQYAGE